jgi:prepilin-type N-terminal cleavage/methylation domain-containing protein
MNARARPGFTLIEVIVGLTVASLALAAGFAALGFVQDHSVRAEEVTRVAVGGAAQRSMLLDWLAGARFRAPTSEQFEGIEADEKGEPTDHILFPTTARTPLDGWSTVVGLYIDDDAETPERGLVAELTGSTFGAEPRRVELVPQAGSMQIRYLPDVDGQTEWVDGWVQNGLPRGIEITLFPSAGDSLPLLLRYPLRVALGVTR